VNFILATGMHAYGFSEGGQLYVAVFAITEIAIVVAAHLRRGGANELSPIPVAGGDPTGA
jgi:hypothetical protein